MAYHIPVKGVTQGFVNCIYNHGGDYSQDTAVKVFWLLFWAAQQFWISSFSGLMGYAMFPGCFRVMDVVIIMTLATGSALVTLIGAPIGHYDLNSNLLVLLPSKCSTAQKKVNEIYQRVNVMPVILPACGQPAKHC